MSHTITRERSGLAELAKVVTAVDGTAAKINARLAKPKITRFDPTEHVEQDAFTLEVYGENFNETSVVGVYKGNDPILRTTTFHNAGNISADVDSSVPAGNSNVYVRNGKGPFYLYSDEVPYKFTKAKNKPVISRLEPNTHEADDPFTLAVIGANFDGDAKVLLGLSSDVSGAQEQKTDWKSSTRLEIQGGRFTEDTYYVWVREPSGRAGPATLTITAKAKAPALEIDRISPTSHVERETFGMALDGSGFAKGAKVQLFDGDGSARDWSSDAGTTDVQNDRMITAWFGNTYNAADHYVRVVNPDGQKSNKKSFRFTEKHVDPPKPRLNIDRLVPSSVPYDGEHWVKIIGSGFGSDSVVHMADTRGTDIKYSQGDDYHPFERESSGELRIQVQASQLDDNNIGANTVTVVSGGETSNGATLTIRDEQPLKPPMPTLDRLVPDHLGYREKKDVEFYGTNFRQDLKLVTSDGPSPAGVTWHSKEKMTASGIWQDHDTAYWLHDPINGDDTRRLTITVHDDHHDETPPAPHIDRFEPNPAMGQLPLWVKIRGSNFLGNDASVHIGGWHYTQSKFLRHVSAQEIDIQVFPRDMHGTHSVTVETKGGTSNAMPLVIFG